MLGWRSFWLLHFWRPLGIRLTGLAHGRTRSRGENLVLVVTMSVFAIAEVAANLAAVPPPRGILGNTQVNFTTVIPHNLGGERRHAVTMVGNESQPIFEVNMESDVAGIALEGLRRHDLRDSTTLAVAFFVTVFGVAPVEKNGLRIVALRAFDQVEVTIAVHCVHGLRVAFLRSAVFQMITADLGLEPVEGVLRMHVVDPCAKHRIPKTKASNGIERVGE